MAYYAPDPIQSCQLIPGGNIPAAGGLLFVYVPGSTTKQDSYTDASASTARTNPIVLDSGGNIPGNGEVWIASTAKFVLAPSNDTDPPGSPYWTRDYVPGINNVTSVVGTLTGEWITGSTATYVGVTQFTLAGDQTALYTLGRRVKATVTGGDRYGSVTSASFATGSTTIGLLLDSSTLNAGLSAVYYGILGTPNGSIPWETITSSGTGRQARIDFYNVAVNTAYNVVSSGASPNIWNQGNVINYSVTNAVSSFSNAPQPGATRTLIITSSTSFNSSAALTLGGATITAAVGDKVDVIATSTDAFSLYVQSLNNPGLTFLASTEAGNTSFVAFYSTAVNSRCSDYEIHIHGFAPNTVSTGLMLRVSTTNGVSWVSTAVYFGFGNVVSATNATFHQYDGGTTGAVLSASSGSRAFPTGMWTGIVNAFNLVETSTRPFGLKSFNFSAMDVDASGTLYQIYGSSKWNDGNSGTTAVNAIQLLYSSGNISTGAVHLYGFKR